MTMPARHEVGPSLPVTPVDRWLAPVNRFLHIEAGIGFTMALFINALAFPVADFPVNEAAGKIGTLAGSVVSAVLGAVVLSFVLGRRAPRGPVDA